MTTVKRHKQARYKAKQKTALIIRAVYSLEMRGIPATVAEIAHLIGLTVSTKLRKDIDGLVSEGVLSRHKQMRLIHIAEDTPEWWIDIYGWRSVYRCNSDVLLWVYPDIYWTIAGDFGFQKELPI